MENIKNRRTLDRRSFLRGAAVAGVAAGAGVVSGLSPAKSAIASTDGAIDSGSVTASPMTREAAETVKWSFEIAPDPIDDSQIVEEYEADVIVIGSGVSGLVTANSAKENGADVILFSAGTKPVARGGSNNAVNTKAQKRLGIESTPESMARIVKREMLAAGYHADANKWWKWVNNSGEAMDWLIDIMENEGYITTIEVGHSDPDGIFDTPNAAHGWVGHEEIPWNGAMTGEELVVMVLEQRLRDAGVDIHYSTCAQQLVRENNNTGRVTSVIATNPDGAYVRYVGRKGIVMATGDFSQNRDMMAKYCPSWTQDVLTDNPVNYDATMTFGGLMPGDGHKMGLWVGAAWQKTVPNPLMIDEATGKEAPAPQPMQAHPGILINENGVRYYPEDTIISYSTYAAMRQPNMTYYAIWDDAYADFFDSWSGFSTDVEGLAVPLGPFLTGPADSNAVREQWNGKVQDGTYVKGDTIDDVLTQLGISAKDVALNTIEHYNGFCEKGVDEDFHKRPELLAPVKVAPFYGTKITISPSNFLCVVGGLRTSVNMEVCDENDTPIEGLYNVGVMTGDMFGSQYSFDIPGHSLGATCITFGYLLGKDLAAK